MSYLIKLACGGLDIQETKAVLISSFELLGACIIGSPKVSIISGTHPHAVRPDVAHCRHAQPPT
eukprot:4271365-Amphidinium_carterae.1